MKSILLFLGLMVFSGVLFAQCPQIQLNDLQYLQKTEPAYKEAKILALGFDAHNEFVRNGATFKGYNKCWQTTLNGQAIFEQKLIWNVTQNTVMFLTLNQEHYQLLREAVGDRHPEAGGQTVVVGKMFRYEFSIQKVEGLDYFALAVALR
ncbi:MAG TPA: hypothetical protein PKL15_11895 [Saprospiraceae bacterium]|nr:hypothetical protein [Saprospiraceae bacterium]HNM26129.1 hypothetical protein [Saprospiraceae bacterium]